MTYVIFMSYNLRNNKRTTTTTTTNKTSMEEFANHIKAINQDLVHISAQQDQLLQRPLSNIQFHMTFSAKPTEDAARLIDAATAWCELYHFNKVTALVKLLNISLSGPARVWPIGLPDITKQNKEHLIQAFHDRFENAIPWLQEQRLWSQQMLPHEKLKDYIYDINALCAELRKSDNDRMMCFIRGLPHSLRALVVQRQPAIWREAIDVARLMSLISYMSDSSTYNTSATSTSNLAPSAQQS